MKVSSRLPLEKGKEAIILRWRRGDVTPGRKSGASGTTQSTLANNRGQTGIHNRENLSMRIAGKISARFRKDKLFFFQNLPPKKKAIRELSLHGTLHTRLHEKLPASLIFLRVIKRQTSFVYFFYNSWSTTKSENMYQVFF